MIETTPRLTRSQFRSLCEDESSSAQSRLGAANTLIDTFGLTARNLRVARRTAKLFAKHVASSPRSQQQVRWLSEKLLARIERALENSIVQPDDAIDENDDAPLLNEQPAPTKPKFIIGGAECLPSDESDDFWDALVQGSSRRRLFCASWQFPVTHTRNEMVAELIADPAKIRANLLELKTSACSRERLDQQFEDDVALIRIELAARGIPDTPEGREQLAAQIEGLAIPLFEFRPREMGGLYAWGPESSDLRRANCSTASLS